MGIWRAVVIAGVSSISLAGMERDVRAQDYPPLPAHIPNSVAPHFRDGKESSGTITGASRRPMQKWRVLVTDPRAADETRRALDRAHALLEQPACAAVLTDFEDAEGRALSERLGALGVDAPDLPRMDSVHRRHSRTDVQGGNARLCGSRHSHRPPLRDRGDAHVASPPRLHRRGPHSRNAAHAGSRRKPASVARDHAPRARAVRSQIDRESAIRLASGGAHVEWRPERGEGESKGGRSASLAAFAPLMAGGSARRHCPRQHPPASKDALSVDALP
jgi:hypothetical protein